MIYAASDLHGNLIDPPEDARVVLLAGDICPDFIQERHFTSRVDVDKGEATQANWLNGEFRQWLDRVSQRASVYAIWGNHDFVGEHPDLIPKLPWTLLEDSRAALVDVHGEWLGRIYGTPWVPGLPYWAFFGSERVLEARANVIPEGIDILMTHGPPYRAGDYIPTSPKQREKYGNYDGEFVGDRTLNMAIRRAQPQVVVCGHIHEGRGKHWVGGRPVYNVASVDERYRLQTPVWTRIPL